MPQKGKRCRAQKQRWSKPDQVTQLETPPPAQPFWTQKDGPSPSQSPAQKMAKLHIPLPTSPSCSPYQPGQVRLPPSDFRPGRGTGRRHRMLLWEKSTFTGRFRKLVVPAESPDKKFVLLVGDSHLRAIADGFVGMPDQLLSFGVLSVPGASAVELRTEVLNAVLPRSPGAVCILAPSNDLTASRTVTEAGVAFGKLLLSACATWPNVCVLDFPPRLTVELALQDLLRQEYHRVAARMGVRYVSATDRFPLTQLDLWCPDGVHLSDDGMVRLAELLRRAPYQQLLESAVPRAQTPPRTPPPARRVSPKVVVKGVVTAPRPSSPFEWTCVGQTKKMDQPAEPAQHVDVGVHPIPLNPVWFSPAILDVMEKAVPAHLPSAVECAARPDGRKKSTVERQERRDASKRTPQKQQVCHIMSDYLSNT
ncbi:uncharacterized protein LOC131989811 [Centropristis striata]|uniref:uncharacterized protein LOC131989811 n=1 Tax=Centropristis striata TaxID=184440 RepID=UPI0027E148B0|nr:uncharacterized protein LOC131989811 [Centropristis striata]